MVTIYESVAGGTTWCWWVFSEIVRHLIEGNLIDRTAVPKLLGGAKIVGWCKICSVVGRLLGGASWAGAFWVGGLMRSGRCCFMNWLWYRWGLVCW